MSNDKTVPNSYYFVIFTPYMSKFDMMSESRGIKVVVRGFFCQNIGLKLRKWVEFWSFEKICDGLTGFCDGLTGLILLHK